MGLTHPDFPVDIGDDCLLVIPVSAADGKPADLSGLAPGAIEFGLALVPADPLASPVALDTVPAIGTLAVRGVSFPTVEITLSRALTASLTPFARYAWACRATLGGRRSTIARGGLRAVPVP